MLAAITAAYDLAGLSTFVQTSLVTFVGIALGFVVYRKIKSLRG